MPAVRLNPLTRAIWRIHASVFRVTGGRVGRRLAGHDILFLTTTGRRSGEERTVGLNYLAVEGGHAVIGSFAGEHRDPAWALNMRADPAVTVQIGRDRHRARAREVEGRERDALMQRFVDKDSAYRVYLERTDRRIPIFVLEPGT